jgi:hypothetical protein
MHSALDKRTTAMTARRPSDRVRRRTAIALIAIGVLWQLIVLMIVLLAVSSGF